MFLRKDLEKHEDEFLAPYAVKSAKSRGRKYAEPECRFRTNFQRDRDRIIHCEAFRRLEYKTQVFVNHEGDHYRTRLTHTIEVVQISRNFARTMRLNEDLCEATALAHDLGHTPFGHRGEEVLNDLMSKHGGFEHNRQSHRVVTLLEKRYPDFPGLNLTPEVLEGIVKHVGEYDSPNLSDIDGISPGSPCLETQVVNVADEIAYMNHDLDDGLLSGMLDFDALEEVALWREILTSVQSDFPGIAQKPARHQIIRRLINALVTDINKETCRRIEAKKIKTLEDVLKLHEPTITFSSAMAVKTKELKKFLYTNLYHHFHVERMADKAARILTALFGTYLNNPKVLPPSLEKAIRTEGQAERKICDYVAGMTDRFALNEYAKLFDPNERV